MNTNEGRIARGWRLTCVAGRIMLDDGVSLILACLQAIATAGMLGWVLSTSNVLNHQRPEHPVRLLIAILIAGWLSVLVSTFLGVALCAAASAALDGDNLTIGEALAVAWARRGRILRWSLVAAIVGFLIQGVARRIPVVSRIVAILMGAGWSLGTMFVLPILALEDRGAPDLMSRSSALIKERWGEGLVGNLGIGAWLVLIAAPVMIFDVVIAQSTHNARTALIFYAIFIVLASSVAWAATRVFSVALYRHAVNGDVTAPFTAGDVKHAFRKRRRR